LGLMASSISNIVQTGFIIGVGLLLDTFVVRTITVPAMAVIVGNANWWPSGRKDAKQRKVRWKPTVHHEDQVDELDAAEPDVEENHAVVVDQTDVETVVEPLGEICVADACTIVKPVRALRDYPLAQENWVPAVASSSSSRAN